MSKKIKISMIESSDLKTLITSMKGEPTALIVKAVNESMPDFNKSELAELLNISRQAIYKHLKS
jgi:predicted transcriptional regulator